MSLDMKNGRKRNREVESSTSQVSLQPDSPADLLLPPIQLRLIEDVKLDNDCNAVCHYKGFTYCGLNFGAIDRIDRDGHVYKAFIRLCKPVVSLTAHDDILYSLMYCNDKVSEVHIHDLADGSHLKSWNHPSVGEYWGNRMVINSQSQLAVGDWSRKQIIIYSLTGEIMRKVSLPLSLAMRHDVSMTSCGPDTVLISDRRASKISRISLHDGHEIKCIHNIDSPGGMIALDSRHILVSHTGETSVKLSILDMNKGQSILNITQLEHRGYSYIFDLALYSTDRLAVAVHGPKSVCFFQLIDNKA